MLRWPWQKPPQPSEVFVREVAQQAARQATVEAMEAVERLNPSAYSLPDPTGRPPDGLPYRWNNPWYYTVPQAPYKPPGSPVTVETLRNLAGTCDVVRACILHLIREVHAVPIRVVPRDPADKKSDATKKRCMEALAWLDTRNGGLGGIGSRRAHFEAACIDDLCVVGAAAVFFQHNRRGELREVVCIDASTIRPRVDIYGWDSAMPYEQWVYGVQMRAFRPEELTYDGIYPISYGPFYKSPVEFLINVIDSTLSADLWNNAWLTEGTGGTEKLALPADWTPEQVMNFQSYWAELLKGNIGARQRTLFVPSGTSKLGDLSRKDQDFQEFQLWLMRRACSVFGVQPASIGYAGEQFKVSQEKSVNITTQFGAGVLLEWRQTIYDDVLDRLGYGDLKTQDVSGEEESEDARAKRLVALVGGGIKTPNEARAIEGDDPIEGGDTLFVPVGLTPIDLALNPPAPAAGASGRIPPGMPGAGEFAPTKRPEHGGEAGKNNTGANTNLKDAARMLRDWERLSLKRLAQGKRPEFEFKGLDDEIAARVYAGLINCRDESAVRDVFRAVLEDVA